MRTELQPLLNQIQRYVSLTEGEIEKLLAICEVKTFRKRQFLDQPGFVSGYRNYILKGAFRSYFIDPEGKEHTVQIAIEDWFVSDFYSYITQTPATLFVEAQEDTTLVQMAYKDIEGLCKEIHALSEYFRITTERAFAFSRHRALSGISMSAEARYLEWAARYPEMDRRISQKVIASYLGMTPEFLSKIKKKISSEC
ncbi:cAMP-binding domain of CRP or a regulatory subunit of cAMP-dependent protein kinases [Robiginitalea myxolifaciens]|uniref:cAMP-binding domain of CRP or a regulatory subunit of cAMP-dependent protein kinases n=1 Tax=Robiginitalea myxolifaciens TaxID=400055 RepID=A0A1I6H7B4_9FLAO|nr:Crp/Fnr family transcriptional regulator [Robiginitalea myxolifaciens]SFR50300.1 cAMP-binding domain of CRP or a regulatory subunit of cAMP-dependent protein kinases [Robiginitalea myxolifaciens]